MYCPNCGYNSDSSTCPGCGAPMPVNNQNQGYVQNNYSSAYNNNPDYNNYSDSSYGSEPYNQGAYNSGDYNNPYGNPQLSNQYNNNNNNNINNNSGKNNSVVIAIVAVAALIIVALLAVFLASTVNSPEKETEKVVTTTEYEEDEEYYEEEEEENYYDNDDNDDDTTKSSSSGVVPPENYYEASNDYHYVVVTDGLRLRKGPGEHYDKIYAIPFKNAVEIRGGTSETYDWCYICHNGNYGWVNALYLTKYKPTKSGKMYERTDCPYIDTKHVTYEGNLNLREGASKSTASIRLLPSGSRVDILADSTYDSNWVYVEAFPSDSNYTYFGFVHSDYLY